jgi:acetylornithine deacetylase
MAQIEDAVSKAADRDDWLSKNRPEVTWFGWKARPHELEESNLFVQQVRNSVNHITGTYPMFIGGAAGLDTRFFVHHGIPAVTCGPKAERIHSFDEIVTIDSTIKTAQVIASTMIEWCGLS